jgi:hypothetical protein
VPSKVTKRPVKPAKVQPLSKAVQEHIKEVLEYEELEAEVVFQGKKKLTSMELAKKRLARERDSAIANGQRPPQNNTEALNQTTLSNYPDPESIDQYTYNPFPNSAGSPLGSFASQTDAETDMSPFATPRAISESEYEMFSHTTEDLERVKLEEEVELGMTISPLLEPFVPRSSEEGFTAVLAGTPVVQNEDLEK